MLFVGTDYNNTMLSVKTSTPYVEYLVDTASLVAVRGDPYWRDAAEARIDDIRKNTINVQ